MIPRSAIEAAASATLGFGGSEPADEMLQVALEAALPFLSSAGAPVSEMTIRLAIEAMECQAPITIRVGVHASQFEHALQELRALLRTAEDQAAR